MGRSVYCVVTAAGSGSRLGNPGPKALVKLAGHPLLHHALRSLAPLDDLVGVVITALCPIPGKLSPGGQTGKSPSTRACRGY